MQPVVSIIVPNYNHAPYLRERLRSVFAQTFTDFEVILLDDASTDGSVEILREFASDERVAHLVVNERNGGSAFKQWRRGTALARGKWVWIAESDDSCAPDLLERLLGMNEREGDSLGLVFAQSKFIDAQGVRTGSMLSNTARFDPDPFKQDFVMDGREFAVRYLKVKNFIPNVSAVILRRSCLADERLWEGVENMRHCGDWLLWSRLLAHIRLGYLADELNAFRDHSETTRRHTSTERKQRFLLEQAAVRSSLASYGGIDQSEEEGIMYDAWFRYFTYRELFSARLFSVRTHGRSRASFLLRFLAFKWRMFKARRGYQ